MFTCLISACAREAPHLWRPPHPKSAGLPSARMQPIWRREEGDEVVWDEDDVERVPEPPTHRLSREFEDVDLRRRRASISAFPPAAARAALPISDPLAAKATCESDAALPTTARERMRSRAGRMLARTRSFAPPRRSKSGVIDESAVPDPDVILLADAVLAGRPTLSPPRTPHADPPEPPGGSGTRHYLRIGRSTVRSTEATVRAVPTAVGAALALA